MFFDHAVPDAMAKGVLLSGLALIWVIVLVRIVGLRSFSKMTNFDFVVTVAMGSLLASAATSGDWTDLLQAVSAMGALLAVQYGIAVLRQRSVQVNQLVQNKPVLLMKDGKIIREALHQTRVSESDLIAKLREANALNLEDVRAVVLETTGDVTVLHGAALDERLIAGIPQES